MAKDKKARLPEMQGLLEAGDVVPSLHAKNWLDKLTNAILSIFEFMGINDN